MILQRAHVRTSTGQHVFRRESEWPGEGVELMLPESAWIEQGSPEEVFVTIGAPPMLTRWDIPVWAGDFQFHDDGNVTHRFPGEGEGPLSWHVHGDITEAMRCVGDRLGT